MRLRVRVSALCAAWEATLWAARAPTLTLTPNPDPNAYATMDAYCEDGSAPARLQVWLVSAVPPASVTRRSVCARSSLFPG